MGRNIRILLFLAALIALNLGAERLFEPIDSNTEYGRSVSSRMARLDLGADVAFMGDSRAHQGLDPRVFERLVRESGADVRAVNLGRPGMQTPFFYYTFENYLAASGDAPDVVFLNVSYYLLHGKDWMDRIYFLSFRPTLKQAADSVSAGLNSPFAAAGWYMRTRVPMLAYRLPFRNVFMPLWASDEEEIAAALTAQAKAEDTLYDSPTRGFSPRGASHIGPRTKQVGPIFNPGLADKVHLLYLQRLFALAQAEGTEIVIYEFPWTEYQRSDHDEATIAHYRHIIEAIGASFDNVRFVEHAHFWPHTYFVDPLHVNDAGSVRLTELAAGWYLDGLKR